MKSHADLIGKKFGKWTVIGDGYYSDCNHRRMVCRCECGKVSLVRTFYLIKGKSKGCRSCAGMKKQESPRFKHGLCYHRLYRVWNTMKARCTNKNNHKYHRYGGRGIKICNEWKTDFKAFYDWCMANEWEEGLHIDRKNNDGNYEPSNCRFVNPLTNSRNSSSAKLTLDDIIELQKLKKDGYSHKDLAAKFNVSRGTIGILNNMDLRKFN